MAFATINLFGVTDPAAGYVQETTREKSQEIATCKDSTGVTKLPTPKKLITETVTIKGKGTYVPVVTRDTEVGATAVMTQAKISQSNEDFPDYEVTFTKFSSPTS